MTGNDRRGTTLGPYRIDALLGRGGMGEVYRATDLRKDRVVALKLLHAGLAGDDVFRDRFMRESRVAARLNDPHVIPIHDWGEIDGLLYIDMRLVEGSDLGQVLAGGPIGDQRAVHVVGQIADALDAAHADGLVHRDIKPDNILLDRRDFAYLVDFGLAQTATDSRLTQTGSAIGSLAYMAPERFGSGPVGPAADVYALACVLYQCVAGRPPFGPDTIEAMIASHLNSTPAPLGSRLDPVIARGMSKDLAGRYRSAGEMLADARAALAGRPTTRPVTGPAAPPPIPPPAYQPTQIAPAISAPQPAPAPHTPPTPLARRSRIPLALAAVVLVLLAAVGTYAFVSGRSSDDTTRADTASDQPSTSVDPSGAATEPTVGGDVADGAQTTDQPTPERVPPGPSAAPTAGAVSGDLGLSVPMSRPVCNGGGIVVVGNATAPGTYAQEVAGYLDANPGARYLRTDQACPSLRQSDDDGNPIYAVYYPAGRTVAEVCAKVSQVGGYGKWLDRTSDPRAQIRC